MAFKTMGLDEIMRVRTYNRRQKRIYSTSIPGHTNILGDRVEEASKEI